MSNEAEGHRTRSHKLAPIAIVRSSQSTSCCNRASSRSVVVLNMSHVVRWLEGRAREIVVRIAYLTTTCMNIVCKVDVAHTSTTYPQQWIRRWLSVNGFTYGRTSLTVDNTHARRIFTSISIFTSESRSFLFWRRSMHENTTAALQMTYGDRGIASPKAGGRQRSKLVHEEVRTSSLNATQLYDPVVRSRRITIERRVNSLTIYTWHTQRHGNLRTIACRDFRLIVHRYRLHFQESRRQCPSIHTRSHRT